MTGSLTKKRLEELFDRLNEKLHANDEHGEIYAVGGAVMALAYNPQRATEDVDCLIRKGRNAVYTAVTEIAREEGLNSQWLNEAVTMGLLPTDADPKAATVYNNTNLTVVGASIDRMIAMKLHGARMVDLEDLEVLLATRKVTTPTEAIKIFEKTYGLNAELPWASEEYLFNKYIRRPKSRTSPAAQHDPPTTSKSAASSKREAESQSAASAKRHAESPNDPIPDHPANVRQLRNRFGDTAATAAATAINPDHA